MKKIKSLIAVLLCVFMMMGYAISASAAEAKLVYSYSGKYATVTDCNTSASGTVIIPKTVKYKSKTYNVKFIGPKAFYSCKKIKKIVIPSGVTAIKSEAFKNCTSLRTVDVPKTVVSCAYDAFDGCNNVTVNCYKTNYQFFRVEGLSNNIKVNVLDATKPEEDKNTTNTETGSGSIDFAEIFASLVTGESDEIGDFVEIDTSKEGITQIITRFIQMFVYFYNTYLVK